jgi:hypothetical protein
VYAKKLLFTRTIIQMKKISLIMLLVLSLTLVIAQSPRTFNLQGVLLDDAGQPATQGDYSFKFRLYDAESAGSQVGTWEETQTVSIDGEGIYQTVIGKVTPIPGTITFDLPYWVEIEVNAEILGRMELTAGAYVLNQDIQDLADGSLSGSKVGTGIDGGNINNASVTTGKISGDIAIAEGGTGASTAVDARTNLGLAIGSNVQAYDADLADLADGSLSGSKVGTGIDGGNINNASVTTSKISGDIAITEGGTGASIAVDARTNLGLAIGSNVQAYDADLADLADGSLSGSKVGAGIVGGNINDGTISSSKISGQIALVDGGTGSSTSSGARTNLGLTGSSNTSHYHDSRYFTEGESDTRFVNVGEAISGDIITDNTIDGSEIQNESITGADIDNNSLTGEDFANAIGLSTGLLVGSATPTTVNSTLGANCNCIMTYGGVRIGNAGETFQAPPENDLIIDGGLNVGGLVDPPTNDVIITGGIMIGAWNNADLPGGATVNNPATGYIYAEGGVYSNTTFYGSSDKRLKDNIVPIINNLSKIMELQSYSYHLKSDSLKKTYLGLLAQDVREVIPEIVEGEESETEFLSISYTQLIPVLIEAMKEQQQIINAQRTFLEAAEASIQSNRQQISELTRSIQQIENLLSKNPVPVGFSEEDK